MSPRHIPNPDNDAIFDDEEEEEEEEIIGTYELLKNLSEEYKACSLFIFIFIFIEIHLTWIIKDFLLLTILLKNLNRNCTWQNNLIKFFNKIKFKRNFPKIGYFLKNSKAIVIFQNSNRNFTWLKQTYNELETLHWTNIYIHWLRYDQYYG